MSEPEIRAVAESLVGNSGVYRSNNSPGFESINRSISHSINLVAADLVAGWEQEGHLSAVRRFFCLLVTFDLLFTCLMWLICIMITGDNIAHAISQQVLHYTISKSLFDIVAVAALRFINLLLFYAVLAINHWWVIALSTAGTCGFLIGKVFFFDWTATDQPVLQVLLILVSFILAWGEAWFLDFRVIPQEINARNFFIASAGTEREPLLRPHNVERERFGNFYSPLESPTNSSDDEDNTHSSSHQQKEYVRKGTDCVQRAYSLLNHAGWKLEKNGLYGDVIRSMNHSEYGKIFKLTGVIKRNAKDLNYELFYEIEKVPLWNPTLLESQRLVVIDDKTDITYQASMGGGGGIVQSRDFINLRHWEFCEGTYVSAAMSVEHPVPPNNKHVRGKNIISCWATSPTADPNKCTFQWLMGIDLKGWIPQSIVDKAFTTTMNEYMVHLRYHCEKIGHSHHTD